MKRLVSLTLALMLALCALAVPTMAEEVVVKEGVLSQLNWTDEELETWICPVCEFTEEN
jgi:hypothetical protein